MSYTDLSYIINQLSNLKPEDNEKKQYLMNSLYENLKIINEINNCPDLKIKILNTLKEIFENYERNQNHLGSSFNNYLMGINPSFLINTNFKNPYNFLRLNCDDFEICKYEIINDNEKIKIKMLRNNFFPITSLKQDSENNPEITERIKEIQVTKQNNEIINIELTDTYKTYINSFLHSVTKKIYNLKDFRIENFNELGFNTILGIIYYEIEQQHLIPVYTSHIVRCINYPDYVEVIQGMPNKEVKFLSRINITEGFNNIENYESPSPKTICRGDANIYTTYILSGNKINSNLDNVLENIENETQKENFKKYYKKINEQKR